MEIYKDINECHHQEIPDGGNIEDVRKIQRELVRKINEAANLIYLNRAAQEVVNMSF